MDSKHEFAFTSLISSVVDCTAMNKSCEKRGRGWGGGGGGGAGNKHMHSPEGCWQIGREVTPHSKKLTGRVQD